MGLSDEERYAKMVHSINWISEFHEKMGNGSHTAKLRPLLSKLWYEFLRSDTNGGFWLTGSDLQNDHMPADSLIGVAFASHVKRGDLTDGVLTKNAHFDSYKTLSAFFDMDRLLSPELAAVAMTYLHVENVLYALCRYNDEFSEKYESLNFLLRTIQGVCFSLFKKENDYSHAWMLHNLCEKTYTYEEKDIVNQWWAKHYLPHAVKLDHLRYDEIFKLFKKYQFKTVTVRDRVDITLGVIGYIFGSCDKRYKEFVEMVTSYNKDKKNNDKISLRKIELAYHKAIDNRKEEEERPYERGCEFTGNYINYKGELENWRDR